MWGPWWPPDIARPPINSVPQENPKYPSLHPRKVPQPSSSSTLVREGSEALPGTLPERGIITGGLGDGACVRVATVHNTSQSLLALNSSRDALDRTNKCAPLHKLFVGEVLSPDGRRKEGTRKSSPRNKLIGRSRESLRATTTSLQRVFTLQS